MKKIAFIAVLITMLIACRKDKSPIEECIPCINYNINAYQFDSSGQVFPHGRNPIGDWNGYVTTQSEDTQDVLPLFNPRNPNELVFIRQHRNIYLGDYDLLKLNIETGSIQKVFSGYINNRSMSWSSTDWIYFEDLSTFSIVKIKSNGDSLTYLTKDGENHSPSLDDKNNLIYFDRTMNKQTVYHLHSMDINGNNIQDISIDLFSPHVSPDGKFIAMHLIADDGITIYDTKLKSIKKIPLAGSINNLSWFPDSKFLIAELNTSTFQVIIVNTYTNEVRIVKKASSDKAYWSFAVSPDCKNIAYECEQHDTLGNSNVLQSFSLLISDINGKNFRKLTP
jgi:Tol biopolymer transport system component